MMSILIDISALAGFSAAAATYGFTYVRSRVMREIEDFRREIELIHQKLDAITQKSSISVFKGK